MTEKTRIAVYATDPESAVLPLNEGATGGEIAETNSFDSMGRRVYGQCYAAGVQTETHL